MRWRRRCRARAARHGALQAPTSTADAERYPCGCSQLIIQSMPNLSVQEPK